MRDTRIIYEPDYYLLSAILLSTKLQKKLNTFRKTTQSAGYPLPKQGFTTVAQYQKWSDEIQSKGISSESFLEDLLISFNIRERRDAFITGLKFALFFGRKMPPIKGSVYYSVVSNQASNSIEAKIVLKALSTKEEFEEIWQEIDRQRRDLPAFKETKNKPWETFERDFKVYELFLQVKNDMKNGKLMTKDEKSPYRQITYYPEFDKLTEAYGENFEYNLRNIISRCENSLKNINLL